MNKNAIKKFAIEARKKLIASVSDRAGMLGITPEGCSEPVTKGTDFEVYKTIAGTEITLGKTQCEQRRKLKEQVESRGFEAVVEEVAYTWFNRICAIRFMEVNDYLPTRVRVLSSEKEGKNEPDIVTLALDVDLDFTDKEREYILDCKMGNKLDELFKMLFIKQCNKLSEILPELFEATEDYTEMLLNISYTNKDDIIYMLVNQETGIPEADFNVSAIGEEGQPTGQVEIIGWLYQYYNTELKDDTFAQLKKNIKISKERIPAATQLFTPDWIVRYMVENSVGRLWIEHLRAVDPMVNEKEVAEKFGWKYYLPEAEQEADVNVKLAEIRTSYKDLKPEDITCIDPCMGSGHILVAMFDVLMDIYKSAGYSERDAAFEIVEHNIHGLDIDKRAYQLAYFAVMMKGRGYNRRFFSGRNGRMNYPKVYAFQESNSIDKEHLKFMGSNLTEGERDLALSQIQEILESFIDAREYGSILKINTYNWDLIERFIHSISEIKQMSFETLGLELTRKKIEDIINIAKCLGMKYAVVVTNPPYMGIGNGNAKLNKYAKDNYPNSKADLFAVFIERCIEMNDMGGFSSMITQHSWMFISVYERCRREVVLNDIVSLVHLGARAFEEIAGEVVQTVAFTRRKTVVDQYLGTYVRLTEGGSQVQKEKMFLENKERYFVNQNKFEYIPGNPIAYWVSQRAFAICNREPVFEKYATTRAGMITGDNNKFIRLWHEISNVKMGIGCHSREEAIFSKKKWFPYNKGGEYRKWYGNNDYVVNWENDGTYMRNYKDDKGKIPAHAFNLEYIFKENITWSSLSSYKFAARYTDFGFLYDASGSFADVKTENLYYTLAFLCSDVTLFYLSAMNPTLNFQKGNISTLPFILDNTRIREVSEIAEKCVNISRDDWDSFETSWDFKKHPLLQYASFTPQEIATDKTRHISDMGLIRDAYELWKDKCESRFNQLKANEEELNRIFIEIYGLQDELTPDVEDKDVTVRKADLQRDIKSLLSYAVGCMFGRYSLDCEEIAYAGGGWNDSKYVTFIPDRDNCIPITDDEYSEDDIVGRLCEWLKKVYGADTLEENLDFIANALGNKGKTSRETIREYFVNDFMADHMRIYQKRPIYWLFDSGKANGFKALVYMHRYNADTVAKVRVDYLHNIQKSIEQARASAEYLRDNGSGAEKAKATKLITKYTKQLAEIHLYDEAMAHIANQRIDIDLDDGVKVNYEKFQGVEVAQEGKKALKIDLLAKIK